jgi:hypothetical protein
MLVTGLLVTFFLGQRTGVTIPKSKFPSASAFYMTTDSETFSEASVQSSITSIVYSLFAAELNAPEAGTLKIEPTLLVESSHILAKGRFYELCMQDLLSTCSSVREVKAAERVDAYLRGFVVAERRSRARMKVNYILAGATSNRLDQAIGLLSERCVCV